MRTTYIPYPSLPLVTRPLNGAACAWRLQPFLRKAKPDLTLATWVHPEGYGAWRACAQLGIPIVVEALGTDLRRVADPFSRHLVRKTMAGANAVITVSRELKEWAVRYGADAAKVYPVLNGSDASVFYPRDRAQMRRKLNLPADIELVVFVGRLVHTKGIRELFEAAAALFEERPRLRIALIGGGPMKEWIDGRAAEPANRERFHVLGPRPAWEIAEWLGAASCLCLPSYSEGCPNVVVEALSSGRPVIATDVGGIPELVNDASGILTAPGDAAGLTEALRRGLEQTWDAEHIHRAAGRSWDDAAEETLAVCRETLARWRSA